MNIQERIRRRIAKRDAERVKVEQAPVKCVEAAARRRMRAEARAEARIEGICNGTIVPRNAKEDAIQVRAMTDLGIDF